jgi:hypothetical protein
VERKRCFAVNVYSKCELSEKRRLWEKLVVLRRSLGRGVWCFIGNFNSALEPEERRGVNPSVSSKGRLERVLFNRALVDLEVEDVNLVGRKFTWYQPNGRAMSRIDRALVSEEWADCWGNYSLWELPRDVSDHCLLVLKVDVIDWGPKPFRFNNFWLENSSFKKVVEEAWRKYGGVG